MRREPDFFESDPALIYIAKKLKEAIALEEVLTAQGIDYLVEPDRYVGGFLFRSERVGAFFYVDAAHESSVRAVLEDHGYRPYRPDGG